MMVQDVPKKLAEELKKVKDESKEEISLISKNVNDYKDVLKLLKQIEEQKKEPEMTVRYYISSADLTAEKFATAIRNHWHVENKLHWRLDVVMNEDDCKIRRGNAAELFSGIRHIAINILTNDKVFKAGLRRKMRKAAMDRNYLASVLAGSGLS